MRKGNLVPNHNPMKSLSENIQLLNLDILLWHIPL